MILLSGTLQKSPSSVHSILRCELGVFSVCDERLNTVSSGCYEGLFEIEAIQPHCLPSNDGTVQWGVVAILKRFSLSVMGVNQRAAASKLQRLSTPPAQLSLFREEEKSDSLVQASELVVTPTVMPLPTEEEIVNPVTVTVTVQPDISASAADDSDKDLTVTESAVETLMELTDEDVKLFGSDYVFSETIALDVTDSRERLRRQRERLKTWGYRFDVVQQVWRREPVSSSE